MKQEHKVYYQSEIGWLEIIGSERAIKAINFVEAAPERPKPAEMPPPVAQCLQQLDEYFKGKRQEFLLDLEPEGTDFQKVVWQQLITIPYGRTVSYLDIAKAIGNEKSVRAVGLANGRNPISVVIPCHRVIGSDGSLTGYGGGLWRKEWLLKHEGKLTSKQLPLF